MPAAIQNNVLKSSHPLFSIVAAIALLTAQPLRADTPPEAIFGNYHGAGRCPPGSAKSCTDTGAMDNVLIQRLEKRKAPDQQIDPQNGDVYVSIRILRDHGQSCVLEGEMYWSGDHISFQQWPPVTEMCRLELRFKNDTVSMKDPRNLCRDLACPAITKKQTRLEGMSFKKGPDQLLAAYKKSATPPPATIFGKYVGTGQCATDERKTADCAETQRTDYMIVKPSETADARVVFERSRVGYTRSCPLDDDAMWLGNHLVLIKPRADSLGGPDVLQFWFKRDSVVSMDLGGKYCGPYIYGAYFTKDSATPASKPKR